MSEFTGLKLNFDPSGDLKIIPGQEIIPHRVDIIEQKISRKELSGLDDMFFNLDTPDCRNASKRKHIIRENKAYEKFLTLTGKLIKFPGTGDISPDAA